MVLNLTIVTSLELFGHLTELPLLLLFHVQQLALQTLVPLLVHFLNQLLRQWVNSFSFKLCNLFLVLIVNCRGLSCSLLNESLNDLELSLPKLLVVFEGQIRSASITIRLLLFID